MTQSAVRLIAAFLVMALSTFDAEACLVPADVEGSRSEWIEVVGEYEELHVSEMGSDDEDVAHAPWKTLSHTGVVTSEDGSTYATTHQTDAVIWMCYMPEGPKGDAAGTFYLTPADEDGRFVINDWSGNQTAPGHRDTSKAAE